MESRFKQLQQKINNLSQPQEEYSEHSQKVKIRTLNLCLQKLHSRTEEENILWEHKVTSMFDHLRKIEHTLKETKNQIEIEDNSMNARINKLKKNIRKSMDRLPKERKQSDKKIQSCLETDLIELTSFKGKAINSCSSSIRELKQIEKEVEGLEKDVKRDSQLSKEIHRKIYSQFSTQIEEIGSNLLVQQRVRQQEEQKLLDTIERTYALLNKGIAEGRKQREKQEKDIVDFLEKIIEKIKHEMLND